MNRLLLIIMASSYIFFLATLKAIASSMQRRDCFIFWKRRIIGLNA